MDCGAVPTTDGGTIPLVMSVRSDSSARTATVTYSIGSGPILSGGGGYPVGAGKVMVLKATRYNFPSGTVERPGPPSALRDTCSYGNPGSAGEAELVHLVPVERPTVAGVQAWCETQSWYPYFPSTCPTWAL